MDFPACPVFEKNVEKAYRSVERAPRAAWRLATVLERADSRWFFLGEPVEARCCVPGSGMDTSAIRLKIWLTR